MTFDPILITGGSGQIGTCLQALKWPDNMEICVPDSTVLNLVSEQSITGYLEQNIVKGIINCGAYTAVDKAESEPDLAMAINGTAPGILARYAERNAIPLIHISTDYVFDGSNSKAYTETDITNPLGSYGHSKLVGEQAVTDSGATRSIILRTAWVLSPYGQNFLKTMLRLGVERETLSIVDDQVGNPTSAMDIARAIQNIILAMLTEPHKPGGIYHFVNNGDTSWHGLAEYIFNDVQKRGYKPPMLSAIATTDYPTPARRPANSRLATDKITNDFAIHPQSWQRAVEEILDMVWEQTI